MGEEMDAAVFVGYTQATWDGPGYDKYWTNFMEAEKAAAEEMGYNLDSWDNWDKGVDMPPVNSMKWMEMTDSQREAAKVLGYNRWLWDEEDPPKCSPDKSYLAHNL